MVHAEKWFWRFSKRSYYFWTFLWEIKILFSGNCGVEELNNVKIIFSGIYGVEKLNNDKNLRNIQYQVNFMMVIFLRHY